MDFKLGQAVGVGAFLGLVAEGEMLQVGICFTRCHRSPAFGTKQQATVGVDGHPPFSGRTISESGEAFSVMVDDVATATRQVGEWMPVGRQHVTNTAYQRHPFE